MEMSGNREATPAAGPGRSGASSALGDGQAPLDSYLWARCGRLAQEVVCFWQPQEGCSSPLALWTLRHSLASSSLTSCLSRPSADPKVEKMKEAKDAPHQWAPLHHHLRSA